MKNICLFFVILLSCFTFYAQDKKESADLLNDYDKDCGNPYVQSQLYATRKGRVVKIISGNKILVSVNNEDDKTNSNNLTVILAGINASSPKAKIVLTEKVLNREVEVVGNLKKDSDNKLFGIVSVVERYADLNSYLLKIGISKYEKPKYKYSVSGYTLCQYRKIEAKAKQEKLGIWAK